MVSTRLLSLSLILVLAAGCHAREITVNSRDALIQAVTSADPGAVILIAPGEYPGGMYFRNVRGEEDRPIIIGAADPDNPPLFRGGGNGMHFAGVSHLELRDLHFTGATANGLNMDDGGVFDPDSARFITLRRLHVRDVGPEGNRDGIKLSGLYDFRVEDCVIERWGSGGSAIDMVGCHRGVIEGCVMRHEEGTGGTGVQAKGGCTEITVRRCVFENAGDRAVNIGGSTGMQFFRPQPPAGYEAKDIRVDGNVFTGSRAPVAFVGVDGAVVRFNTIYLPGRWALRILQEARDPDFVPSRNGQFTDNIVVFRSDAWMEGGVNIGPGTAPETFTFARNAWYCQDHPDRSTPRLPAPEEDALVGVDPLLADPGGGDFSLQEGSPAAGKGHTALPEEEEEDAAE